MEMLRLVATHRTLMFDPPVCDQALQRLRSASRLYLHHVSARTEWLVTDQFDLSMELSGYAPLMSEAQLVVRGDREAREFVAFWVDGGRIVAGMNVNVPKVNKAVQALIRSGEMMNVESLRDPSIPLERLVEEH